MKSDGLVNAKVGMAMSDGFFKALDEAKEIIESLNYRCWCHSRDHGCRHDKAKDWLKRHYPENVSRETSG